MSSRSHAGLILRLMIGVRTALALMSSVALHAQSVAAPPKAATPESKAKLVETKATETILPLLSFRDTPVPEVIKVITRKTGLAVHYHGEEGRKRTIDMELYNESAANALRFVAEDTRRNLVFKADGVHLEEIDPSQPFPPMPASIFLRVDPPMAAGNGMICKEWIVPPGFIDETPNGKKRLPARDSLTAAGIPLPPGSSAQHLPLRWILLVKSTKGVIHLVDQLVEESIQAQPEAVRRKLVAALKSTPSPKSRSQR